MRLNRLFATIIVLLVALALSACATPVTPEVSPTTPPLAELEEQVRAASAAWDDAFNAGDLLRLMALYAEESVDMPPNLPALEGKTAIESDLQYILDEFTAHHQTSIIDIKIGGDLAIERANYAMTLTPKAGGEPMTEVGKHIVVRQKSGDEWKVVWEIWNSDESPATEPAEEATALEAAHEEKFVEAVWANENAFQAGDVDRIIEFYAEDAVSMPPGFPVSAGKEAIEADLRFFFDEFVLEREFTLVDYEIAGDYATRQGEWTQTLTPKAGGDPVIETGRCTLGFKKFGDEWKVVWEIWNTYEPPAAE